MMPLSTSATRHSVAPRVRGWRSLNLGATAQITPLSTTALLRWRAPQRKVHYAEGGGESQRWRVFAAKRKGGGFGGKKKAPAGKQSQGSKGRNRTQTIEEEEVSSLSGQDRTAAKFKEAYLNIQDPPADTDGASSGDFDSKIAALKAKAPAKPKAAVTPSVLQPSGSIYDSTITQPSAASEDSDERKPNTLMQVGAVLSVLIFIVVYSGSDLVMSTQGGLPVTSRNVELSSEIKESLQGAISSYEAALIDAPQDITSLEGAAVSYATLGEYKRADEYLQKLVEASPSNFEAYRLQGEVRFASEDFKGSVAAYKKGLELAPDNLELLRGIAEALKESGKQAEAVSLLLEKQKEVKTRGNTGIRGPSTAPVDDMQVSLLLGKLYSGWAGHSADAARVYENLINDYSDDFRGYLAKGALLKEAGKAKEADRLFLQARFLAPEEARPLVDRVIGRPVSQ